MSSARDQATAVLMEIAPALLSAPALCQRIGDSARQTGRAQLAAAGAISFTRCLEEQSPDLQSNLPDVRIQESSHTMTLCINCTLKGTFCGSENEGGEISATARVTIIPQT